jgi:drug/metabolite transporter (DMT)-like permease
MNLRYLSAGAFIFAGAVFLFTGLRSEPRQTVSVILGVVFLILGSAHLTGRLRR